MKKLQELLDDAYAYFESLDNIERNHHRCYIGSI